MHQHALDDAVGSAAMLDNLFKIAGGVASISRRMSSASKATAGGGRPPQLAQRPREFARVARGGIGGVTGALASALKRAWRNLASASVVASTTS